MPVAKKLKLSEVKNSSVLLLSKEKAAMEAAVGDNYYLIYPLPGDVNGELMAVMRDIWYKLMSEKETKYAESISAAKALSQNLGEVDEEDTRTAIAELMGKLTESTNVHPLEFLSHSKFSDEIKKLLKMLLDGCDEEDIKNVDTPQQARLLEICFIQNFLPFVRLANNASRIFRGGSD